MKEAGVKASLLSAFRVMNGKKRKVSTGQMEKKDGEGGTHTFLLSGKKGTNSLVLKTREVTHRRKNRGVRREERGVVHGEDPEK